MSNMVASGNCFSFPKCGTKVFQLDTILEAFEDHLSNIGAADGAGDDDTAGDRDEVEMQLRDEHVEEQGEEVNMQEQEDVQMEEGRPLDEQAEDEDQNLTHLEPKIKLNIQTVE